MAANPARTFAIVNLVLFAVAIAAFLWLRHEGVVEAPTSEPSTASSPVATDSVTLSSEDVQPLHPAQLAFLNEVLVDTTMTLSEGFSVKAQRGDGYYTGARIGVVDTSQSSIALWWVQGARDAPRSVKAINDLADQYSIAGRVTPQDDVSEADPEAQLLRTYLTAQAP